jgi:predicted lipoprotein with Yx(FWY)xxD motif
MNNKLTAIALAAITAATTTACASAASSHAKASNSSGSTGASSGSPAAAGGGYGYGSGGSSTATNSGSSTATAARGATVHVAHTSAGSLLVASNGFTLYLFTADHGKRDHCVKVSGCASVWPPLTVSGKPTAGPGARSSLLGTISLGHGRRQVTYAGHPLYRYANDGGPAATGYLGFTSFGGTWDGVSPSGHAVH